MKNHKRLLLSPIKINETSWYYEERPGLCVVAECYRSGRWQGTISACIPWKKVKRSLERYLSTQKARQGKRQPTRKSNKRKSSRQGNSQK